MTAETDIAAVDDSGANTASEVRTALTSVLGIGRRVLLDTGTISSSVSSVTFTSISQAYDDLIVILDDVETADSNDQDAAYIRLGGSGGADSGSNYEWQYTQGGDSQAAGNNWDQAQILTPFVLLGTGDTNADRRSYMEITIPAYAAAKPTFVSFQGGRFGDTRRSGFGVGMWYGAAAVETVDISADGGNLESGTIYLYGIKWVDD